MTSANGKNFWKCHDDTMTVTLSKRCHGRTHRRTDGPTDIQTERSVLRAAWSRLIGKFKGLSYLVCEQCTVWYILVWWYNYQVQSVQQHHSDHYIFPLCYLFRLSNLYCHNLQPYPRLLLIIIIIAIPNPIITILIIVINIINSTTIIISISIPTFIFYCCCYPFYSHHRY